MIGDLIDWDGWMKEAKKKKAYAIIVGSGNFSYEYYPVYVMDKKELEKVKRRINKEPMDSVKDVIILDYSK